MQYTLRKAVHTAVNQTDCATESTNVSGNSSFLKWFLHLIMNRFHT